MRPKRVSVRHSAREFATAVHEAGHAVIAHYQRLPCRVATSQPDQDTLGHVGLPHSRREFARLSRNPNRVWVERRIMVCLAGALAEQRVARRGVLRGAAVDHENAVEFAETVCGSAEESQAYVQWLWTRTKWQVELHWPAIEALARVLLERRTIRKKEIQRVIESQYR